MSSNSRGDKNGTQDSKVEDSKMGDSKITDSKVADFDIKDSKKVDFMESGDIKDSNDKIDSKVSQDKDSVKDSKDLTESKNKKDSKDSIEFKGKEDSKDSKDLKKHKDSKSKIDSKKHKDSNDKIDSKKHKDSKNKKEDGGKKGKKKGKKNSKDLTESKSKEDSKDLTESKSKKDSQKSKGKEDSQDSKKHKDSNEKKDSQSAEEKISKTGKISKSPSLPQGFKVTGIRANIKYKNRFDLALLYSKRPCVAAGVWTKNSVQAACITYNKAIIDNQIHAIMINSGYANACTGEQGRKNCEICANDLARLLKIEPSSVLLASTGVIGEQLPMDRILKALPKLVCSKKDNNYCITQASRAIMTTDTYPKTFGVKFFLNAQDSTESTQNKVKVRIWGVAKGSGMIHPNMGTMLGFLLSDVAIDKALLKEALDEVVQDSFNQISVDGDTSTNDMAIVLANGKAGNACIRAKNEDYHTFKEALKQVCVSLAKKIARDGEGATHLLEVEVKNAREPRQARTLSKAIIKSNLVKTAIFGKDANWGRIICAMGYSESEFDATKLDLLFESKKGSIEIAKKGCGVKFSEAKARNILGAAKVKIIVNLNDGEASAKAWGCDLSYDYIKINADYRS